MRGSSRDEWEVTWFVLFTDVTCCELRLRLRFRFYGTALTIPPNKKTSDPLALGSYLGLKDSHLHIDGDGYNRAGKAEGNARWNVALRAHAVRYACYAILK